MLVTIFQILKVTEWLEQEAVPCNNKRFLTRPLCPQSQIIPIEAHHLAGQTLNACNLMRRATQSHYG